ncbi:hypothetical protein EUTSA_v10012161mg [Eutrema salsugineum]|uniref:TF-B3 domain-containing protein n=2 Tax=Eutrema salsugineum TaxID=72664 RepID=V4KKF6_EUTSA|nr:hypothetical protein EUTSA_v10012161mg [Eutrema salsugineum]
MRPFKEEPDNALVATATKKVASCSSNAKYKGVVQQQNGHWGAQIYTDHKRIWLGTFKSAAEAATAYDSASILLRSFDANSHRNFPCSDFTVHEPRFQKLHSTEAVLNMIRDGSYQQKFKEFLSQMATRINTGGSKQSRGDKESDNKCFSCKQLFQKKLTPSDVGKLNRLVIPKKYAVKHLPYISIDQKDREEGEISEEVEVVFYDTGKRQWKFRYCYWRSSQSFVFTRGWNGFVKEKNLKENDVILFYECNLKTLDGQSKNFWMIDILFFSDDEKENESAHNSSVKELKTENFISSKLEDEETKSEKKKGGFKLFGVMIQ